MLDAYAARTSSLLVEMTSSSPAMPSSSQSCSSARGIRGFNFWRSRFCVGYLCFGGLTCIGGAQGRRTARVKEKRGRQDGLALEDRCLDRPRFGLAVLRHASSVVESDRVIFLPLIRDDPVSRTELGAQGSIIRCRPAAEWHSQIESTVSCSVVGCASASPTPITLGSRRHQAACRERYASSLN